MKYQKTDDPKVVKIVPEKKGRQSGKTPIGISAHHLTEAREKKDAAFRLKMSQKGLYNIEKPKKQPATTNALNLEKAVDGIIAFWNAQYPKLQRLTLPKRGENGTKTYLRARANLRGVLKGSFDFSEFGIEPNRKFRAFDIKNKIALLSDIVGKSSYSSSTTDAIKKMNLADFIKNDYPNVHPSKRDDKEWVFQKTSLFYFLTKHSLPDIYSRFTSYGDEELFKQIWRHLTYEIFDKDEFHFDRCKRDIATLCDRMEKRFRKIRPSIIGDGSGDHYKLITQYLDFVFLDEDEENYSWNYSSFRESLKPMFKEECQDDFFDHLCDKGYLEDKLSGKKVNGKRWYEMTKGEQKNALLEREEKRRKDEEERKRASEQKKKDAIEYARIERNRRIKERLNSKYKASKPQKHRDPVERKKADELVKLYRTKYKPKLKQLGIAEEAALHLRRTISKLTNSFDSYTLHIKWCDERFAKEE